MDEILAVLERVGTDHPPTDAELSEARAQLVESLRAVATGDAPDLEAARALREQIDTVDAELQSRRESAEANAAEAAQLLEGLDGSGDDGDGDGSGDDGDGDGQGGGDGDETAVGEGEAGGEGDGDGGGGDAGEGDEQPAGDAGEQPVAAGLDLRTALSRVNRPRGGSARVVDEPPPVNVLVNGPAINSSAPRDIDELSALFTRHAPQVTRARQTLVSIEYRYPDDRALGASGEVNTRLIERVLSPRALVAAGGICEPVPADFAHPICGDRGRPIRDSLPQFGAARGGVRFSPTATVADLEDAITVWTHANDQNPVEPTTKACPAVDCEDEVEELVDAVVACLTVGNFQSRFNPEFWRSRLDLLMVAHDRVAEQTLFATMQAAATAVTVTASEGTARSLFLALDRAAAGIRSRHRLLTGTSVTLRFVAPMWLRDAIRASLTRQQPGDGIEAMVAADALINRFFDERDIRPVWSPDLQVFGAQAAAALEDWPDDEAVTLLHPEGTFFFLDGGTLDLGTEVRDSGLNATNDRQAFLETFEKVAFRGCESLQITVPVGEDCVCPAPEAEPG